MKKVLLKIDGMTCSACSTGLEKYLNKQDGIKQATVNLIMNNANIEYDDKKLTLEQIEKFVEKLEQLHPKVEYVNKLMENDFGKKIVRFYDLDGNLIEVGTPM